MREPENAFPFRDGNNRENEFFRDIIRGIENYEKLWDMPLDGICYSQRMACDPDYRSSSFSDTINYLSRTINKYNLYSVSSDLRPGDNIQYHILLNIISRFYFKRNFGANTCYYVSRYKNTRMNDLFFPGENNLLMHNRLIGTGKEQFKTSRDIPSGILAFSEALDNRIPMQVNLTDDDREDNGIWRFYVRFSKGSDIFHLRNLCCYLLPDDEINRLAFELKWEYDEKCVKDQISILRKRLSAFVSNRKNGLFSVVVAKKKENAESILPPYPGIRHADHSYDGSSFIWYEKSFSDYLEEDPPYYAVEYPLSIKKNAERLVHLLYFDYLVYKILNAVNVKKMDEPETDLLNRTQYAGMNRGTKPTESQSRKSFRRKLREQEKDCFCLFIPEFASANPVSSGIIVSTSGRISAEMLPNIEIITSQLFKPVYIAALIDSSKISNIKTAVGAVMSRNGSHNIGSHVLSALSHQIGIMPDDRGFYQYIQQRMGYIANVTTGFPGWTTSTMFVGDMMRTFFSQYHLLEHIADSEGLHAFCYHDLNGMPCADEEQPGTIRICIRRVDRSVRADGGPEDGVFPPKAEKKGKETIEVKHFLFNGPVKQPFSLDKDVSLAIPGGVIGQHAFFTILENIIRNAAKHGWSSGSRPDRNETKSLEIHISFEVAGDEDTIEFTIWDNVSDVFSPFYKMNDSELKENMEMFFKQMKPDESIFSAEATRRKGTEWIDDAIKDEEFFNDVRRFIFKSGPVFPDREWKYEQEFDSLIRSSLSAGEIAKLKTMDFKSFLPLHMQQEILLEQPLINESGGLRHENWGMAEMKISAGYLLNCGIRQIGGLEQPDKDARIIQTVAVRKKYSCPMNISGDRSCSETTAECPYRMPSGGDPDRKRFCPKWKSYHLGYRFKIRKQREMLIVLKEETGRKGNSLNQGIRDQLRFLKQEGVYIAQMKGNQLVWLSRDNAFPPDELVKDFNFEYVIFPTEEDARNCVIGLVPSGEQDRWVSYYPFRLLVGAEEKADARQRCVPATIAYDELIEKLLHWPEGKNSRAEITGEDPSVMERLSENILALKSIVYRDWLAFFKSRPGIKEMELEDLSITIKTDLKSHSSREAMFTTGDLLDFVFRNLYVKTLNDAEGMLAPGDRNGIAELKKIRKPFDILKKLRNDSVRSTVIDFLYETLDRDKRAKCQETVVKAFLNSCNTCYSLLTKDECNIASLPSGYFEKSLSRKTAPSRPDREMQSLNDALKPIGIRFSFSRGDIPASQADIKYIRHFSDFERNDLYSEGISGCQSYFDSLYDLTHSVGEEKNAARRAAKISMIVRLVENALLRILIIDERASRFLHLHPEKKKALHKMNVFVADFSDKDRIIDAFDGKAIDGALNRLPLFRPFPENTQFGNPKIRESFFENWEVLIIHQGVIDKWLSGVPNKKEAEGILLDDLKRKVPYIVVTTGRGRPDNIPAFVKILPFSSIESALFCTCPEKAVLTAALMNLLPAK